MLQLINHDLDKKTSSNVLSCQEDVCVNYIMCSKNYPIVNMSMHQSECIYSAGLISYSFTHNVYHDKPSEIYYFYRQNFLNKYIIKWSSHHVSLPGFNVVPCTASDGIPLYSLLLTRTMGTMRRWYFSPGIRSVWTILYTCWSSSE